MLLLRFGRLRRANTRLAIGTFKSFDWTNQGERSRFFRVTLP